MDAGIGVGGLSTGKDEFASSCFDLFSYPEIETGIEKAFSQTFRPISSTTSKGPFTFDIPADPILISLLMLSQSVFMVL